MNINILTVTTELKWSLGILTLMRTKTVEQKRAILIVSVGASPLQVWMYQTNSKTRRYQIQAWQTAILKHAGVKSTDINRIVANGINTAEKKRTQVKAKLFDSTKGYPGEGHPEQETWGRGTEKNKKNAKKGRTTK